MRLQCTTAVRCPGAQRLRTALVGEIPGSEQIMHCLWQYAIPETNLERHAIQSTLKLDGYSKHWSVLTSITLALLHTEISVLKIQALSLTIVGMMDDQYMLWNLSTSMWYFALLRPVQRKRSSAEVSESGDFLTN